MLNPKTSVSRGQMAISTPTNTVTGTADTYVQMAGTFTDSMLNNWSLNADGTLTFNGNDGSTFLFNGVSDLEVDKACTITYGLYKNGVLVTGAETPHTFAAASKIDNVSITRIIQLDKGDYLNVFVKSSATDTTATINTLFLTFWGEQ